ncbi:hypothetical protein P3T21_005989 [Paraburkholderia sp. GAS334]
MNLRKTSLPASTRQGWEVANFPGKIQRAAPGAASVSNGPATGLSVPPHVWRCGDHRSVAEERDLAKSMTRSASAGVHVKVMSAGI